MRRLLLLVAIGMLLGSMIPDAFAQSAAERVARAKQGVRQGNAGAQNDLGVYYRDGVGGLRQNDIEAARLFKLSAAGDDPLGLVNLGAFYSAGRGGLPRDDFEALRLYRAAAAKGNARALNNVGSFYQNGRGGLQKDDREAGRYYRMAVDQGDAIAQANLGVFLETGRGGYAKNDVEAVRLFRLSAKQGFAGGQNAMGITYELGRGGVTKDLVEAVRWYRLAADQGHPYAQSNLGTMYVFGRGVAKDEVEGVRWHRLAADQGNPRALANMGYTYEMGRGNVLKDDREALRYYRLAAEQNDVFGQANLANFHERGRGGLEISDRDALRLYRLAADQGNARAQARVGWFYEQGRGGLNKDDIEAAKFYKLAADQGDPQAKSNLENLTRQIPAAVAALSKQPTPPPVARDEQPPQVLSALPSIPTHASIAAEKRVALVIGNSAYSAVPVLPNPVNDARQIADALRANGFTDVRYVTDATRASLIAALSAFQREADAADWAVIYYAGHGIEISGTNYLVPVDARLRDDRDVQDEAVAMNRALDAIAGTKKLKLVILDACRDNPFLNQMRRVVATRSVSRGLAAVEPLGATLVVYAAKDGETAEDGDGRNSPFTTSLIRRMQEPGIEINRVFRLVTGDVLRATNNRQRPFVYGSLPGEDEYYFKLR